MSSLSQVRERFLEAVAGNDISKVLACYQGDAVLTAPEGRYVGRDYIEVYYRIQFAAFPDGQLNVTATHDCGDIGVGEWTFVGTNTGALELPGSATIPPTGKRVTQRGADVALVRDGLIAEHRLYYDQLEVIEQLGLQPTPQG